jgi:hypothetical protein
MKLKLNPIHWLFVAILISGCATVTLLAATVTASFGNPNNEQWDKVRLYRKVGTTYTLLAEVNGTVTNWTGAVQAGTMTLVARSVVGTVESPDSNVETRDLKPDAPILKVQ